MEVKFVPVRIGTFRQELFKEKILKENYLLLKESIRNFLKTIPANEEIQLDIVIPARGYRVTVTLDAVKDRNLITLITKNFNSSIYQDDYSVLEQNLNNPIFPLGI